MKNVITSLFHLLQLSYKKVLIITYTVCLTSISWSQVSFNFQSPVRISGTDLQVNAKYRFSDITTATDAIVTIVSFNGGAYLTELDGISHGYAKAFQPVVHVPANANGYVELKVEFVTNGTSTAKSLAQIPITLLDIDAASYNGEFIYEHDRIEAFSGYSIEYEAGTELDVNLTGGWAHGRNVPGSEYLGIDTLKTKVMFTVTNYNQSSFSMRLGGNNNADISYDRLKSVFFKSFTYSNLSLLKSSLNTFKGVNNGDVNILAWEKDVSVDLKSIQVQKSDNATHFATVANYPLNGNASVSRNFQYNDTGVLKQKTYYRLQFNYADGRHIFSQVLLIYNNYSKEEHFNIYPNQVNTYTTISYQSGKIEPAIIKFLDYSGNLVHVENINLNKGTNNICISSLEKLRSGNYLVLLSTATHEMRQKMIKQ